ncbi:uncharacterized protein [Amphiura filiformis]|uniref:uncharacterized protein n=1 Tax=Amphiura filiformis TaxID=82378 RepID=UPI003B219946
MASNSNENLMQELQQPARHEGREENTTDCNSKLASNSNDNLMQQLRHRERHEVTTDQVTGNGSSATIPMPASIHGENVSVVEQQTNVSGDQKIIQVSGDNYQAHTMNVFVGDKAKDTRGPVLSLKTIRRELMEEYRETRGKLPLLPGMPEEFAKMEDIFVDLEIIEEDKKPSGLICKKLNSYGDLVCIERNNENSDDKELVKRILVKGKPGAGKSTTISKLSYDWACNKQDSPMSKFELVFVITVNEIDTDTDLIGAIRDQLLPKVSRENLEELLQSHSNSVAILFDGYDEATSHFDQCKDIRNVLCSKWLAGACVIVTSRPNLVGKFCQKYGSYLQVEIIGFSWRARKKYVKKFLRFSKKDDKDGGGNEKGEENDDYDGGAAADNDDDDEEEEEEDGDEEYDVKTFLYTLRWKSQSLGALSAIPIILSMLCLIWTTVRELPISVTALYKDALMHLAKHKYAKTTADDLDESNIHDWIDNVLFHIGEIAIIGLFEDRLEFKANGFEKQHLEDACTLGVLIKERKRSRTQVTYSVTFLHKTFQEMCAASYLAKLVDRDRETLMMYLGRINHSNVFKMDYFLRFACGLSVQTAEIILPHVVQLMCKHRRMMRDPVREYYGGICNIDSNVCQKMPLFLLYEAEINAQTGSYASLHALMKPLYDTVVIGNRRYETVRLTGTPDIEIDGGIDKVLDHFMLLSKTHYIWLDDVRVLEYGIEREFHDCKSKLLYSLSRLSILRVIKYYRGLAPILPDITSLFNHLIEQQFAPKSLVELCIDGVCYAAESFGLFSSSLPCLAKLTLIRVEIRGELPRDISYPALEDLHIKGHGSAKILSVIESIDLIDLHNLSQIHVESTEFDDLCQLGKAMKYMPHLRRLALPRSMPSLIGQNGLWGVVFDKLAKALQNMKRCKCKPSSACGTVVYSKSVCNVQLRELDLSENTIGHSIGNFVRAYRYMPHLKSLKINSAYLEPQDCEVLFDGLIEVGCKKGTSISPGCLKIETLILNTNNIGDSVDKLCEAIKYMPNLKELDLRDCNLTQEGKIKIRTVLVQENGQYRKGELRLAYGTSRRGHIKISEGIRNVSDMDI